MPPPSVRRRAHWWAAKAKKCPSLLQPPLVLAAAVVVLPVRVFIILFHSFIMSYDDTSDIDKLKQALSSLVGKFSSVDDMLAAFGLDTLPTAQRYGIFFGFCVFTFTITAVMLLLILGGSFARIAQQAKTNDPTTKDAVQVRKDRALLLERLLETRNRMLKENYSPPPPPMKSKTKLTEMLMNEYCKDVADLVAEDSKKRQAATRHIPEGYEENYKLAYRTCQDKPGGTLCV